MSHFRDAFHAEAINLIDSILGELHETFKEE